MGIGAVFFDLFNTLAFYYPTREERHAEAIRQFGFDVGADAVRRAYVEGEHFWTIENARKPVFSRSRDEMNTFLAAYETHLLAAAGIVVPSEQAIEIYRVYRRQAADLMLYEDVQPTLSTLKARGFKLGLISNIEEDVVPVCIKLGLESYLSVMVGSATAGFEKPDSRIFRLALELAKVDAEEALHVGDQYHSDVVGARQCGMLPVLLDRHDLAANFNDCIRIQGLNEVLSLV